MTLLAAIYARVSDEASQTGEDKVSIPTQVDDCRARAAALGAVVVHEYVDDRRYRDARGRLVDPAGWRADRPQWRAMLEAAERGEFGLLIAWHSTRLFRGYKPMSDLLDVAEKRKLRVECVRDSFNTELAPIYAWAAKQERLSFVSRSLMGKLGRVRRGLAVGQVPAHYERILDMTTGKTAGYKVRPEARQWLDDIARLYLDGHSIHTIARTVKTNPITGYTIWPAQIASLLNNRFNFGRVVAWRNTPGGPSAEYAGLHEPAWDADTCAALEAEMAKRRYPNASRPRPIGIFSGVVRCGYCGRNLATVRDWPYTRLKYVCWAKRSAYPHPWPGVSITEAKLVRVLRAAIADTDDASLAEAVAAYGFRPAASAQQLLNLQAERDDMAARLADLEADIQRIQTRAAREAVAAQIADVQADMLAIDGRIVAAQGGGPAPDSAAILDAVRRLRDDAALWELPADQLRPIIHRTIPALYVAQSQLVAPPALGQDAPAP